MEWFCWMMTWCSLMRVMMNMWVSFSLGFQTYLNPLPTRNLTPGKPAAILDFYFSARTSPATRESFVTLRTQSNYKWSVCFEGLYIRPGSLCDRTNGTYIYVLGRQVVSIIIHEIFSLARDCSKHVTWPIIPQLTNTLRSPRIFIEARSFSRATPSENCSLLGTDHNVRVQIS